MKHETKTCTECGGSLEDIEWDFGDCCVLCQNCYEAYCNGKFGNTGDPRMSPLL